MVTRRAVLKGTAAASIGAIAAAHGATPIDAAALDIGYGQLESGAAAGFSKYRDAYQIAVKFHKIAVELFLKEAVTGGVDVFFKFFHKEWTTLETQQLSTAFPDLKTTDVYFSKIESASAEFFVKNELHFLKATISSSLKGLSYDFEEGTNNPDGGDTCFPDGPIG